MVAVFSKELSPTDFNSTAHAQKQLELVEFLSWFKFYFERSAFDIITDKEVIE